MPGAVASLEKHLPWWEDLSFPRRAWELAGGPLSWGLVCGLLAAKLAALYPPALVIGILGGLVGGAQHRRVPEAVARGAVAATLFGAAILVGLLLFDDESPDAGEIVLLAATTVLPGLALHAAGSRWRRGRAAARDG